MLNKLIPPKKKKLVKHNEKFTQLSTEPWLKFMIVTDSRSIIIVFLVISEHDTPFFIEVKKKKKSRELFASMHLNCVSLPTQLWTI